MKKTAQEDFFWLSILAGLYLLFWAPIIDVHPPLSLGDNGRDFYAAWMTLQGKRPCWDYHWFYGPLMPLYYAFWFLVGGVNLVSLRIGLAFNYFFCSFFAYRALRHFTSGFVAFLASLAFLSYNLTWTYNHLLAIPFLLLSLSFLWKFFRTHEARWCYGALLSLVGVALVKVNTGLSTFAAFYVSLLFYNSFFLWKYSRAPLRPRHLVFLPLLFGVLVFGFYGAIYSGLTFDQIDSCLTLSPRYHQPRSSPWINFKHLILYFFVWKRMRLIGILSFLLVALLAVLGLKKKGLEKERIILYSFVVLSLVLFGFATTAEYFVIHSIIFRFDFWLFPIAVLLIGLCVEWAGFLFPTKVKFFLVSLLFLPLLRNPYQNLREYPLWRQPERFLAFPHGRAYVGGFQSESDVGILRKGTQFILEHTQPHETLLAIPYEPLYCFLSGRRHAVPETSFTQTMPVAENRQESMIRQFEDEPPPYVILSNRYDSNETNYGRFGKTHCQKLAQYIFEHYEEIQTFGPWDPTVSEPHAIKILHRKKRA